MIYECIFFIEWITLLEYEICATRALMLKNRIMICDWLNVISIIDKQYGLLEEII